MTLVIPAIDLLGGKCVRLYQGAYDQETVYHKDPAAMALEWQTDGARVLHVVDLDAARGDRVNNRAAIASICAALEIPVQLGGGIRTIDDVTAALDLGIYRVIIGTAAVRTPELVSEAIAAYGCERVVVGIDAKDGEVKVQGWLEGSGIDAIDLALDMERRGVRRIVYTDISRDGTLAGPNVEAYRALGKRLTQARITASGGVGAPTDIDTIHTLRDHQVDSIIVGRALYENKFARPVSWCWTEGEDATATNAFVADHLAADC
ncbi:MAG: 1-(5-phosphoribosyl)-5-[(5-phosphoribosylamino)methylideneamino]imidazole-4-carboxamide isomerase [Bacteroidota bacterium]